MKNETRLYGVSFGNGNDGVSHMFADYYVRTNQPYRLATATYAAAPMADSICNENPPNVQRDLGSEIQGNNKERGSIR